MSRGLACVLLIAALAALALRCPELAVRPMHNDEAVNAIKLQKLWDHVSYQYDPEEYHGPTLLYAALAWMKLVGPHDFVDFNEVQLRLLTVAFGVGLILLLPLLTDGLGPRAIGFAACLIAVSPAMVFYSRYFIHEMLLAFFTLLALGAAWRYWQSRKLSWALLAGAATGLMQATKETFVLTLAAMAGAWILTAITSRRTASPLAPLAWKHVTAALGMWLLVVIFLFSSFFTNARGPIDAVRTYLPWLHRAGGASPHIHPWYFYLERLAWFHSAHGPVWTEAFIIVLAITGVIAAFRRQGLSEGQTEFARWLAFYTIILTVLYSAIAYKTPWCLLSFWNGAILLAGIGAAAWLRWLPGLPLKIGAGALMLAGAGQLAFQAWHASVPERPADLRSPYAYSQTSLDVLNLVSRIDAVSQADPHKNHLLIKVMAPDSDFWPLPWYLRQFDQVGWWPSVPPDPFAQVMIVSTQFSANLDAPKTHLMVGIFELRPQVFFEVYVAADLWRAYLDAAKAGRIKRDAD